MSWSFEREMTFADSNRFGDANIHWTFARSELARRCGWNMFLLVSANCVKFVSWLIIVYACFFVFSWADAACLSLRLCRAFLRAAFARSKMRAFRIYFCLCTYSARTVCRSLLSWMYYSDNMTFLSGEVIANYDDTPYKKII